jgi:gluconokinase
MGKMKIESLRSPHELVGGLVHFGRMLDKIRLHATGKLPADYHAGLGKGFDGYCCQFLCIEYSNLVARVATGGTGDDILAWCYAHGHKPGEFDIAMFNDYLSKRGWRDAASTRFLERKTEAGLANRDDVQTFFDLIDVDEERL